MKAKWLILFCGLFVLPIEAQVNHNLDITFETTGITGSGKHAPFWHTSNRQGLPSVENNQGYMHFAFLGTSHLYGNFNMDYGIDLGAGVGLQSDLFVHQLYTDLEYKWLSLSIGMKERWNDKNRYLSTGALTWSGNSRPIPEIRVGIPEYVRIPITDGWLSLKGHLGYGHLTDERWRKEHGVGNYVEGVLFHSKSGFLRIGNQDRFPLQFSFGLEMSNLFGGIQHEDGMTKPLPSDAATYLTVLFPFHHVENQGSEDGDNFGSWHFNFDYKLKDWDVGVYYEHFFEDHSSMLGVEYKNNTEGKKGLISFGISRNWLDGLYGIKISAPKRIKFFHKAVFEFMNTRSLCGSIRHSATDNLDGMYVIEEVDGRDDMYNHHIYTSDTHWGYVMGNPVLISPVYNDDKSNRLRSNRVQMFHLGVDGGITDNIDYRFLATTTRHWGCYGTPLNELERVTSLMLECSYRLGDSYGWKFTLSGAMDFDSVDLIGNNKGVMLTVSKTWRMI